MVTLDDIQKTKREIERIRDNVIQAEAARKTTIQNIADSIGAVLNVLSSEQKEQFIIAFSSIISASEDGKIVLLECTAEDISTVITWFDSIKTTLEEEANKAYEEILATVEEWKGIMSGGDTNA